MHRGPIAHALSLTATLVLSCAAASAQPDLGGSWQEDTGTDYQFLNTLQIVQVGHMVSACFGASFGCTSGTVSDDGHLTVSGPNVSVDADLIGSDLLDGWMSGAIAGRFFYTRLVCFDGNRTDGDGCSARGRIEPCFTCSESSCAPLGDGAACDDGSPCTSGETCTPGRCGGGGVVTPCTDLSGRWLVRSRADAAIPINQHVDLLQTGDQLLFRIPPDGVISFVGTIAPATGTFTLRAPPAGGCVFSGLSDTLTGAVDPGGTSWSGTSVLNIYLNIPRGCGQLSYGVIGTRCGGGTLDPGEQCDDGNVLNGDGCSSGCRIEPSVTPTPSPLCPSSPRSGCRPTTNSALLVRTSAQGDDRSLLWTWAGGGRSGHAALGDPVHGSTFYSLCIYGAVANAPYLAMQMIVPPAAAWVGTSGWDASLREGGLRYRDAAGIADGVVKLQVLAAANGAAKIRLQGHGAALPIPPPATADSLLAADPRVVVQLVNTDGACWQSTFPAARARGGVAFFKGRP